MEDVEVLMDQNYPHECIKKIIDWRGLNPLQEARTLSTDVFQDVRRRREEAPLEDSRENLNSIFSMDTLVTYLVYTRTRIVTWSKSVGKKLWYEEEDFFVSPLMEKSLVVTIWSLQIPTISFHGLLSSVSLSRPRKDQVVQCKGFSSTRSWNKTI